MNNSPSSNTGGVHSGQLFTASCLSLIATSIAFSVVGAVMGPLKEVFLLTNQQVGQIGGAALYGFALSIVVLGPLCDILGMKNIFRISFLCHFAGTLMMIFASGFWMLYFGALIIALGNGGVEAAGNPLVATLYPDRKTQKLNQFHVWFPGGILIGGLLAFMLTKVGITSWQIKLSLILVPTVIYGFLFLGQKFPATERVQSGISFKGMLTGAFGRLFFWILLITIAITASLELGPNRWIPAVLEAGGLPGILVLAYISGLMAILRFFAGPVVEKLSPTGIILCSAILAGIGLYCFSYSDSLVTAFLSATVFAVGVCYFWPTLLGITSERVPRSGALGLALMGGTGMLTVGLITAPTMGGIADKYLHQELPAETTVEVLAEVVSTYPLLAAELPELKQEEAASAVADASGVLMAFELSGELPPMDTANALRSALRNAPAGAEALTGRIHGEVLGPADNKGGRISFRYVAPLALVVVLIFGVLYAQDRKKGGYQAEQI